MRLPGGCSTESRPTTTKFVPFFAEYGAAIVAALDPQPGCRFLDLGAGRGALTAPALARGCVVTAVAAAPAMAGRLAASYPAARLCLMDVQGLGLVVRAPGGATLSG
jgi:hypothetical protein